ncbi:MAG: Protein-tyrosine kinase [Frankiales bacterium]|nr:Protein-tyrosine kinase [Frankiales bacterium]
MVCALVALTAAIGVTLSSTKIYTAKSQLFVSVPESGSGGDGANGLVSNSQFSQQRVKSYVSVITSIRTGSLVKADLGLDESAGTIASKVAASAPLDTVLINVSVKDSDPARAMAIANSVGTVFPGLVDQLEKPRAGGTSPISVKVSQSAELPTVPTSPRPKLNLALGLLVGLAVGVGGAVLRETLDTSVKGPDHAQELVGAPVLGAISYDADASKKPLVVVHAPSSVRAEAFRQLRTNLQFVDIEHPLRSVVITSSVPGEGKSTTTCNLAITLAQAGLQVVLVEGDLRRPRIADYMGMEGAVGLTSVLLGRTSLEDALQPWGDGALQVLASGPLPPNPSELLGSQGMQDLLRQLEGRADIVLIDAPPLLPVTDAAVLGTLTSGLVMLIRSNQTRREQVARAVATVNAVGATLLGGVLNMVPTRGPDAYSYGYGYGYSYKPSATAGRLTPIDSHVAHARGAATPNEPGIRAHLEAVRAPASRPEPPAAQREQTPPAATEPAPTPAATAAPSPESPAFPSAPVVAPAEPPAQVDYFSKATTPTTTDSWWERNDEPGSPAT